MVEKFHAGLKKSVSDAFRTGSIDAQFHANIAIDGITVRSLGGAVREEDRASSKGKDVVDQEGNREVTEPKMVFPTQASIDVGSCFHFFSWRSPPFNLFDFAA